MQLHHLGYACLDISAAIQVVQKNYKVLSISDVVFDPYQNTHLCIATLEDGSRLELVSGPPVQSYIKNDILNFYHTCYEVDDFWAEFSGLKASGAVLIGEPCPAIIFNNRLVCFFKTDMGLIELLDAKQQNLKESETEKVTNSAVNKLVILGNYNIQNQSLCLHNLAKKIGLQIEIVSSVHDDLIQNLLDPAGILHVTENPIAVLIFFNGANLANDSYKEYVTILKNAIAFSREKLQIPFVMIWMPHFSENSNKEHNFAFSELKEAGLNIIDLRADAFYPRKIFDYALSDLMNGISYLSDYEEKTALTVLKAIYQEIDVPFKVIVVDADNTLWSGVCAEDDINEIKIFSFNLELQSFLIEQEKNGFLICLVSKNIEEDVFDIMDNHPDMLLRRHHIVSWEINWSDKVDNLLELSEKLNLGLDSFIFIDDRKEECMNVNLKLPAVFTIQFEGFHSIDLLKKLWIFNVYNSNESRSKTKFYRENTDRFQHQTKYVLYSDFLADLNIIVNLVELDSHFFPRISELSYRTTQFNCSNVKLNADLLGGYLKNGHASFVIKASDRFGDYGVIGFISGKVSEDSLLIDNFFISCRSLNKGIEYQIVKKIFNSYYPNVHQINFLFKISNRNVPAKKFLEATCQLFGIGGDYSIYRLAAERDLDFKFKIPEVDFAVDKKQNTRFNKRFFNKKTLMELAKIELTLSHEEIPGNFENASIDSSTVRNFLSDIWLEEFKVDEESFEENIFSLGADSLTSIRLASAINKKFNLCFGIKEIYENPSLRKLCDFIINHGRGFLINEIASPEKISSEASINQKSLFLLNEIESSWYYNMPLVFLIEGNVNIQYLSDALGIFTKLHPSLRSNLKIHGDMVVFSEVISSINFEYVEMLEASNEELVNFCRKEESKAFDLSTDVLSKFLLIKSNSKKYILFIKIHHIVSDGWSESLLCSQLEDIYNKLCNQEKIVFEEYREVNSYSNYCALQKRWMSSSHYDGQLNYWKNKLAGASLSQISYDNHNMTCSSFYGEFQEFSISKIAYNNLQAMSVEKNITFYTILVAVFSSIIAKHINQEDILIGSPFWNRNLADFEKTVGYFVNLVFLRINVNGELTLNDLISQTAQIVLEAQLNQDIPFSEVLKNINLNTEFGDFRIPKIVFSFQNDPQLHLQEASVTRFYRGYYFSRFDLVFEISQVQDELIGCVYHSKRYSANLIRNLIASFSNFLEVFPDKLEERIVAGVISSPTFPSSTAPSPASPARLAPSP